MKRLNRFARLPFLAALLLSLAAYASVRLQSGTGSGNEATVDANKNLATTIGASTRATFRCTASGLATTALYSMQINAGASLGFKLQKVCVGTSNATAAAAQTVTIQRRTTAASSGTAATAEGTATPAISKMSPSSSAFSGICTQTPTLGTAGAVLDSHSWMVGELGSGTADVPSALVQCFTYGEDGAQQAPSVAAGATNGISIAVSASGTGGLASGSITATFIEE